MINNHEIARIFCFVAAIVDERDAVLDRTAFECGRELRPDARRVVNLDVGERAGGEEFRGVRGVRRTSRRQQAAG